MDPHWEKVKDIFQIALEKSAGAKRERYLNEACGADENLRAEVLALLASFDEADGFLDESPIAEVAETIVGRRESLKAEQRIGRYRIERRLGAGGAGEVFLARDTELERFVALKILSAEFSGNPDHVRRFLQEARAASALNHPNILTIYESGQIEDVRFIAAEYVEGETLRTRLRRERLSSGEIFDIFEQTAAALNAAHRAGIVHRDIKPENIMIRADGLVKVLDFGLAKLVEKDSVESQNIKKTEFKTTPGLVMGTVAYMSPEQARGLPTDERTDVWSLGVCLSETIFGVQPFTGETVSDQIASILKSEPEPPTKNVPTDLTSIIGKCLEKKVENRYQKVNDFLLDVKDFHRNSEFSNRDVLSFARSGKISANGSRTGRDFSAPPTVSSAEYIVTGIKRHKVFTFAASIVAVAALGLILYFAALDPVSSVKPIHSIAVLPFVNESDDTESEYLSDGLSESLINKLSQLSQLKVASRSSAFQYKNKTTDIREIARALDVEAIVSGRITRRGDDLQIGVEMIDAAEGTQLWGETYRRKITDAQTIQDEIAQNVLQKLQFKLSGTEARDFNAPITSNGQAYQLYLNGVFYRRKNGPENVKKAIEYQKQAIALDPEFALAYAELGTDYYILVFTGAVDPQNGMPPARRAIEKALRLNDTLAEAHTVNAIIKAADFDWTGAEAEYRRTLQLNPNLAYGRANYSEFLSFLGRFDESLREIKRAQELDPLRVNLVNKEGEILLLARRYNDALAVMDSAVPEAANETFALIHRARAYAMKGRYDDALSSIQKSLAKDKTAPGLIHLGRIYALIGNRQEALGILDEVKKLDSYVSPSELAVLYAALGMNDQAFASLEQALTTRDLQIAFIKNAPEYDALRGDPRFTDLLSRMNFSK